MKKQCTKRIILCVMSVSLMICLCSCTLLSPYELMCDVFGRYQWEADYFTTADEIYTAPYAADDSAYKNRVIEVSEAAGILEPILPTDEPQPFYASLLTAVQEKQQYAGFDYDLRFYVLMDDRGIEQKVYSIWITAIPYSEAGTLLEDEAIIFPVSENLESIQKAIADYYGS